MDIDARHWCDCEGCSGNFAVVIVGDFAAHNIKLTHKQRKRRHRKAVQPFRSRLFFSYAFFARSCIEYNWHFPNTIPTTNITYTLIRFATSERKNRNWRTSIYLRTYCMKKQTNVLVHGTHSTRRDLCVFGFYLVGRNWMESVCALAFTSEWR